MQNKDQPNDEFLLRRNIVVKRLYQKKRNLIA